MASLYDLPKVPSPYPGINPWYDLRSYLINDWHREEPTRKAFVFWAKLEANEVSFYLRTRRGTGKFLTETLPDELLPPGDRIFNGFMSVEGNVGLLMRTSGRCQIYAPGRASHPIYGDLIDGELLNLVFESTYVRRPA